MKNLILAASMLFFTVTMSCGQDYAKLDNSSLDVVYYPERATKRSFAKTDEEKIALKPKVRILYSRPLKKGREIFGGLLKYDEPWRLGANEGTEIMFFTDVMFGDTKIKAGRYSMFAVPSETKWTLKLNTEVDTWGIYTNDANLDIATVTVPVQKSSTEVEALSMIMYEKSQDLAHLKIGWDKTYVEIPVKIM